MAVKIKRERPDQRRHHRVTAPLFVTYDGHRVRATDWSLGGLRIDEFPGTLPAAASDVSLQLTLPFQGFDVTFEVGCEVVRTITDKKAFAVRYKQVGERERELMSHFIEELVRGSMLDVQDTIQRIDVPVTPASLLPDANPKKQVPIKRWPVKAIVMTAIYGVIGVVIFGYTALLSYSNFFRMEVQTAVITAPVESVSAQAEGRITLSAVKAGDDVRSGAVIARLTDNQLEREIELAEISVRERKAQLIFLKRKQADEIEKVQGYANAELRGVQQNRIEIESLLAQVSAAENLHWRLQQLHKKGFTTDTLFENAEKQAVSLKKLLEAKQSELKSRVEMAQQNVGKRFFNGNAMVGDTEQIEAQVRLGEQEVTLNEQKLGALHAHRERLAVVSPFDGTLIELPHVDRGAIKKGDTVAVIEQRQLRQVTAFLNQDEILRIGLGDEATIYVPALGETTKAVVSKIDRTSGFIQEELRSQNPGYRWRGPVDRTAKVSLMFKDQTKLRDVERYRSGLPVIVVFPQRSASPLMNTIRQRFITSAR